MRATGLEVADIFRQAGPSYRQHHADALSRGQRCVMSAIERCRTAALGGHVEQCDSCGHQRIAFNSCLMGPRRSPNLTRPVLKKADPAKAQQIAGKGGKGTVE